MELATMPRSSNPRQSPLHSRSVSPSSKRHAARMPTWRVMLVAVAMCGIQICYAAQINLGTAHLLLLGINERTVSLAWLAGPLSGLIVQPIVGLASDSCTSRLGRRRPFLIAGAILTAAALLIFSNTKSIAMRWFRPAAVDKAALHMAIFAFFMLDFSIQAIQAPLRALVTDVVPISQRSLANAFIAFFVGVGNLFSGLLAGSELRSFLPFQSDVQALFAISAVVLLVTVFATVWFTSEIPITSRSSLEPDDSQPPTISARSSQRKSIVNILRHIPRPFWQIFAVNLCTWCGFFTLFVYVNSWVGRNIFLGDGTAAAETPARRTYERGVRLGGNANALTAAVTLVYSLVLPRLQDTFGILPVYTFALVVEAVCLMAAPFINGTRGQDPSTMLKLTILVDIGLFGIVWGTTVSLPWTLIGNALESDPLYGRRIGFFTTLFNVSLSFPQLVVAFVAPLIMSLSNNDPSIIMFCGGACAALGAFLVIFLRIDQSDQEAAERQSAIYTRVNSKPLLSFITGDQKSVD